MCAAGVGRVGHQGAGAPNADAHEAAPGVQVLNIRKAEQSCEFEHVINKVALRVCVVLTLGPCMAAWRQEVEQSVREEDQRRRLQVTCLVC
jgi:hypothetical protein